MMNCFDSSKDIAVPEPLNARHFNQIDLARRWKLSPRTLERWRWLGHGPRFLKVGGRVLYRLDDVRAFEELQLRRRSARARDAKPERASSSGAGEGHSRTRRAGFRDLEPVEDPIGAEPDRKRLGSEPAAPHRSHAPPRALGAPVSPGDRSA